MKLKNPLNNQIETRKITFAEISCSIIKNNDVLVKLYSNSGFVKFSDTSKKELQKASNILKDYIR